MPVRRRTDGDAPGGFPCRTVPSRISSRPKTRTFPFCRRNIFSSFYNNTLPHIWRSTAPASPAHPLYVIMMFRTFSVGQRGTETMTGSRPDDAVLGAVHDTWRFAAKTGETSGRADLADTCRWSQRHVSPVPPSTRRANQHAPPTKTYFALVLVFPDILGRGCHGRQASILTLPTWDQLAINGHD
jgi:hypothetical protein